MKIIIVLSTCILFAFSEGKLHKACLSNDDCDGYCCLANNSISSCQPFGEIGERCNENKIDSEEVSTVYCPCKEGKYCIEFVTLGLIFILLLLLLGSYWNFKKKIAGFPFYHLIPYLVYCQVTGKISIDTPFNNVAFEKIIKLGQRHAKEGLFMTHFYEPVVFIFSEELIKFFANEKAVLDKEYTVLQDVLGDGIVTSNGKRWKTHRKIINPVFNLAVLKEKVPLFNDHAMALVKDMETLAGKPYVDILGALKLHYFNALSESIFGLKQDEENNAQFLKMAEYVDNILPMTVQRMTLPWLRWKFLLNFFPSGRKFLWENKEISKFAYNRTVEMKKLIFSNGNEDVKHFGNHFRKSFTYLLLNHHLKDPSAFTLEDLCDETKTIIGTGYDTVAHSTMWCLYCLGLHPEIQEKAYTEIESKSSDYITYEESGNLTYLEAVLMESLRVYPTVPFSARNLSEDIQCGKYNFFKGTAIVFFPYLSHRDPKVFPDPEKFEPGRFLNPEVQKSRNFIPFSEGKRSCIGKTYGILEMKIFLAHIIRNIKITSLDRREDIKLCYSIVLSPTKNLRFKITKRHNESS